MSDEKKNYATVALTKAIGSTFTYRIPAHLKESVQLGCRVRVPLRNRQCEGVVVSIDERQLEGGFRCREMGDVLSESPILTPDLISLAVWMSTYYCTPLDKVIQVMLPAAVRKDQRQKEQLFIRPALPRKQLITHCSELRIRAPLQAQVLDLILERKEGLFLTELTEKVPNAHGAVKSLEAKGFLALKKLVRAEETALHGEYFRTQKKRLTSEQEIALGRIIEALRVPRFEVHLLQGITGSGKTEVYLQAIDEVLKSGKGAILLVPEVALTPQTIDRFRGRFEERVVTLHHQMAQGAKHAAWKELLSREASLIIGARSAVFAPIPHLGLIIVDEEHETSYKESERQPTYHARDIAVMRGFLTGSCVLLGSATPSFESRANVERGKYTLSKLTQRAGNARPPVPQIIDMNGERERNGGGLLSATLLQEIREVKARGEQSLLFLNRRGFFTSLFCKSCGEAVGCAHCSTSLTFHRSESLLSCHLCGYQLSPPPAVCPKCHSCETMRFRGIGTEQIETTLHKLCPELRTLRMDGDTTRHKGSGEQILHAFRTGKADLLIGTQMIAKGHHFPNVTLVGILHADAALSLPDYRATESLFQMISQVAGRAGRGDLPGKVLIQTFSPDHKLIEMASRGAYDEFYREEIEERRSFEFPPWTQMVKCLFIGSSSREVEAEGERWRRELLNRISNRYQLYPLQPAGYARIKGEFRFHFLIVGPEIKEVVGALKAVESIGPHNRNVRRLLDIHPTSTFF